MYTTAGNLVFLFGSSLVGRRVMTYPMGDFPGGIGIVTEIDPDPACPEIVFTADHGFEVMGQFADEMVTLLDENETAPSAAQIAEAR